MMEYRNMSLNCLQASIEYYCEKTEYNQVLLFANCFGIEYDNQPEKIFGHRIRQRPLNKFEECFYSTYGITLERVYYDYDCIYELERTLFSELLLRVDAYDCPWNAAYNKSHITHFCIIKKVDITKGCLVCADPFLSIENVCWPFETIPKKNCMAYRVIQCKKHMEYSLSAIRNNIVSNTSVEKIKKTYEDIKKGCMDVDSMDHLFESNNPSICYFSIISKQICDNYKGLKDLFEYLAVNETGNADKISLLLIKLERAQDAWRLINVAGIKMLIKNQFDTNMVEWLIDKFDELCMLDLDIYKIIENI